MKTAETIVIAGPTGAGKTELSLLLAERLGGEIVGADAFQIYAGFPLLSSQPTAAERAGTPHHLVGHVDPAEPYDAVRYRRDALAALDTISSCGKRAIVVGGTGLYLKSLFGGIDALPGRDPSLRREFSQESLPGLMERFRSLDPAGAASIDSANRHRVERALEIVLLTGKPLPARRSGPLPTPEGFRGFLLTRPRAELEERIASTVARMFARGVLDEVATLPESSVGPTASRMLGLREMRAVLRGELSRDAALGLIVTATRRYAKRQMTWFRGQHDFEMLDLSRFSSPSEAADSLIGMIGRCRGGESLRGQRPESSTPAPRD